MTKAEINILLRARAREARVVLQAVKRDLERVAFAGANAGGVLDGIAKASAGYAASLGNASKAAADLAKNLSLIGKSGGAVHTKITNIGTAAEYAAPKVAGMAIAVDKLTGALIRNEAAATTAASSLRTYATAAKAASAATATQAASAAATGTALATMGTGWWAAQAAQRGYTQAAADAAKGARNARTSAWDYSETVRRSSERMDAYSQAMRRAQQQQRALGAQQRALAGGPSSAGQRALPVGGPKAMQVWGADARNAQNATRGFSQATQQANTATSTLSTTMGRTRPSWTAFSGGAAASVAALDTMGTAMRKAGSQMQWTGRQLSAVFTMPTALALGFGVKWALEQEKAFTRMAKVYDGAIEDIDKDLTQPGIQYEGSDFDRFFRALSEKMGITKTEVAEIGATWAQVGAQGRNLAEATKLTTEFMVVGDQDAMKSAQDLISIQAQYKIGIGELKDVITQLNSIENATAVSMKDLTDGFTRVAATAREAGVDARHLGAFLAALVPAAGTAAVSANGLKSIFTRLISPANDAKEALRTIGIDISDPNWLRQNAVERLATLSTYMKDLSQQQKFDLAKPFAGLYQINKFVALMDDLGSAQGYYQKALNATADSTKNYATYQRELDRVLESNPQKFKQIGVILQNALVEIIQPLLPHILWLAQGLAKLMKSFSDLSPATQKWIVIATVALALVGPLAMVMGSFLILFGVIAKSTALLGRGLLFLLAPLGKLGPKFGYLKLMARGLIVELAAAGRALAMVFRAAASGGAIAHVGGFFSRIIVGAVAWAGRMWGIIGGLFGRIAPFLARVVAPRVLAAMGYVAAGLSGPIGWALAAILTLIAFFPQQTWEVVKALVTILAAPFVQSVKFIGAALSAIPDIVSRMVEWVAEQVGQLMGDGGVPTLAIPFVLGVRAAGAALVALPKMAVAAFQAVVRVITAAAKAVYQAFSYINPFARHSPSLVDNVTSGMEVVKDEFADMASSVAGSTARAYEAINRFGGATAGLTGRAQAIETGKKRDSIGKLDPGALAAYDQLGAEIGPLEAQLESLTGAIDRQKQHIEGLEAGIESLQVEIDAADKRIDAMNATVDAMTDALDAMRKVSSMLSDELEKAKERLAYFQNAPIEGMRAMSDAIFENEMAQKRLRLEILKLEEAGQSVDSVKDKFASLQGEIENLMAQREGLRLDGAGSDILGVYDKMIADLQAQQGATATEGVSEIEKAQKELERLQAEGEKLDLENALKFDPLTRQIEQLTNAQKELSFNEIVSGINSNKAAVDALTIAYDASNLAIEAQEGLIEGQQAAIKAAEDSRDALNEKLGVQNDLLDAENEKLKGLEEQHGKVEEAIDAVKQAMDDLVTSADTVNSYLEEQARLAEEAAREAERLRKEQEKAGEAAAEFANAGLGDWEVPGGENFDLSEMMGENLNFDDLTQQLSDDVANALGKVDLMQPIRDMFTRIGDRIKAIPGNIGDWFVGIGAGIGQWFSELPGKVGGWLSGFGTSIGSWFGGMWDNHIWPFLSELPGKIGGFLQELPTMLVEAISYVTGYLAGMVAGAIGGAFALGKIIWDYFASGRFAEDVSQVWGSFASWLDGIWDGIYNWATTTLPDAFMSMWNYFAFGGFSEDVAEVTGKIVTWLTDVGLAIMNWATHDVPEWFGKMWDYFTGGEFLEDVGAAWDAFYEAAGNIIGGLKDGIVNALIGIKDWVYEHMIQPFVNGFKDALGINSPSTVFAEYGLNLIQGLWEGIKNAGSWFKDKILGWVNEHIPEPIRKALDMHSPSRVFMGFGRDIAEGLAIGIEQGSGTAEQAAAALADAVAAGAVASGSQAPADPVLAPPTPEELAALSTGLLGVQNAYATAYDSLSADTMATAAGMQAALTAGQDAYRLGTEASWATLSANVAATNTALGVALTSQTASTVTQLVSSWESGRNSIANATVQIASDGTLAFQTLADNMVDIMTNDIVPMFDSFDPMLQTVTGWFDDTVSNIGTIWSGIKEPVAVPSRFIVNDVYNNGIKVAWNNVSGWLGLNNLPDAVAAFESGGIVARSGLRNPSNPLDISGGGKMFGPTYADKTLFAGMGGEYVLSRPAVNNMGGLGVVDAMHRAAKAGRSLEGAGAITGVVPGFAEGGIPGIVLEGQNWARRTFTGQPYVYGGVGPGGFDCSGAVGAMWAYLTGKPQPFQRWFDTEVDFSRFGFQRGLNGAFTIGVHNGGGGGMMSHVAATLGGINLEAGGAHNTSIFGGPAAGADSPSLEAKYTLAEIGGVFASGGMGGGSAPSMLERVTAEFKRVMDPIRDTWPQVSGSIAKLDPAAYQKNYDEVSKHLFGKASEWDAAHPPMGNLPYDGSGVEQWRSLVQKVLAAKGLPLHLDQPTLRRMQQESGGNPNAINLWDSNAQAGIPSKGLMQVIDPTFQRYKDAGYENIWAPEDNIRASMNYALAEYGSLESAYNRPGGYDSGGILPPTPNGYGTYYNHTGKPEAVLTYSEWSGVFSLINSVNKFSAKTVETGVTDAMVTLYGSRPTVEQAAKNAEAISDANKEWTPILYDAAQAQVSASNATASAAKKTQTGVERFVEVGKSIQTTVNDFSELMLAISAAAQNPNSFGAWAPVLNAAAKLIENLPEAKATYVPWAGTAQTVTDEMKKQKAANDAANAGKGLYNVAREVLPPILKHTAAIGTAIESLIVANGPIVAAAIAMFPVNPIGAAIMLIPVILQSIFTILPLIINAIMDIVPALIKAIINFITGFGPDSVYAYDSLEAAEAAVKENEKAIKRGASAPYFVEPNVQSGGGNAPVTINIYGGVNVSADSADSAGQFVSNLQTLK